jgi:hypothetical protein
MPASDSRFLDGVRRREARRLLTRGDELSPAERGSSVLHDAGACRARERSAMQAGAGRATCRRMTTLQTIEIAALATVSGGAGWGETFSSAWQGTKNFSGGLGAGLLHGATGRVDQVSTFADPSSQATKAGFESGAAINMATGKFGDAVSAGADYFNPSSYK